MGISERPTWKERAQELHDENVAMRDVVKVARVMAKHQADRHELSSCCNDVTPTAAYLLTKALDALDKVNSTERSK